MSKSNAWDELLDNEISIPRLCSRGGDPVAGMSAESPSWAHNKTPLVQSEHYQSWITLRLVLAAPWVVLWSKQRWLTVTALEKCISNPCPEYFQLEKILFRDQAWPVRFGWLPAKHTNCGDPRLLYQIAAKIATLCSPIGFLLSAPCNFFTAEGLSVPCVKIAVILPQDVRAFQ